MKSQFVRPVLVIESIDKSKFEVVPIAITKEGNWLGPAAAIRLFPKETQRLLADEKRQRRRRRDDSR